MPDVEYRQRARALRARFAGRPSKLYPALQALAQELDSRPAVPSVSAVVERGFADGVTTRLATGTFTGTDRVQLLAAGQQLGIDRFRVNLILALQLNKRPPAASANHKVPAVLIALVVQALVVSAGLWAWLA